VVKPTLSRLQVSFWLVIISMVLFYTNSLFFTVQKTVMCTLGGMACVASWDITNAGCFLRSYPPFKVSTFVQSIAASRILFVLRVSCNTVCAFILINYMQIRAK